ncbi:MAG: DUF2934 domain-containing protein [Candidatus Omnitrophica bacterium]|nr:DUF2934 domain-containing protein [Candidatus Omnitrophota bacterium]MDE2010075.1 DUF2934 domain-containing protein [Candidatus Omnitrophota bacterium]MDE2215185.1 DUF2934 domain-containing protein [Candidatus Omnitrophota bacterium]MDE2232082.1 DUF2934 domain-containing protein [Candidatus Omnitrophota bacterium]
MIQANTVKRTTVKTNAAKNRVEAPTRPTASGNGDLQQRIAEKAYELYLKRNGGPGSAEEDWAKAEKIVKGL